jgi:N-acetylglucosamine kinase-like BadF-type ATPase
VTVLLAVDGGNSKTDVALLSGDGSVLAAVRGTGSSPHHVGLEGSMRLMTRLVDEASIDAGLRRNGEPIATLGAWFMAGADLPAEERALQRAVQRLGLAPRNHVANDTFAILRAGAEAGWGVAVVVGAGVNCVGVAPNRRTARFLALGDITGDWGGGPDIGMAALGMAVRGEDGRGPRTQLGAAVAAHFGKARATDVAMALHRGELESERLLELAPIVLEQAGAGEEIAAAIVERQCEEVAALATAAIRRLRLTRLDVEVVLGGGILAALQPESIAAIEARTQAVAPRAHCVVCRVRPVVGAALAALDLAGARSGSSARVRRALSDSSIREVGP